MSRCLCGAPATNQAVYEHIDDGVRFFGSPVCDEHRYRLGEPENAKGVRIVDHYELRVA